MKTATKNNIVNNKILSSYQLKRFRSFLCASEMIKKEFILTFVNKQNDDILLSIFNLVFSFLLFDWRFTIFSFRIRVSRMTRIYELVSYELRIKCVR